MPTSPSNIEGGGQGAVHECIMEMGVYLSRTGTTHQTLRTNKRETDVAKIRACIDLTRYRVPCGVRTREGKEHVSRQERAPLRSRDLHLAPRSFSTTFARRF